MAANAKHAHDRGDRGGDGNDRGSDGQIGDSGSHGMEPYYVGIDIGTTTVKICVIDQSGLPLQSNHLSYAQASSIELSNGHTEQHTRKILDTIDKCLLTFNKNMLEKVTRIGICGQMHGVCMWKYENQRGRDMMMSNLITWMDTRCDPDFLTSLPRPDSHLTLSTGHGCATLFWLQKFRPQELEQYDCAGTIMDLLVAILCDLGQPIMSYQNAASWGYFDCSTNTFNSSILEFAAFPCHLLPVVAKPGSTVGQLKFPWFGIKAGTSVDVALGDLQCSAFSAISSEKPKEGETSATAAFVNISTSAQIAYVTSGLKFTDQSSSNGVEYFPFFGESYLAVGASLNGGNVLSTFVRSIQNLLSLFGQNVPTELIWPRILEAGAHVTSTTLRTSPLLYGERHCPDARAAVTNLSAENQTLGDVARALCQGLIFNLGRFVSPEDLIKAGIQILVGTGSALLRNSILQEELRSRFERGSRGQVRVVFTSREVGAEFGVAEFSRIESIKRLQ